MSINLTFHPLQQQVYEDPHRFKVINCGRRWGKTYLASNVTIIEALKKKNGVYWLVSPTHPQTQIIFRMIESRLPAQYVRRVSYSEKFIELVNGSRIWAKSGDNEASLRGEGLDGCVVDEASRVKEEVWKGALQPALSDKLGWGILISTPNGYNWYYDEFLAGWDENPDKDPEYQSFIFPSESNPFYPKSEVERLKRNLPDILFQQEILAQFIEGGGSVFRNFQEVLRDCLAPPENDHQYVGGVDLGRHTDFTVISILDRRTREVVYLERFNKLDWDYIKDRIENVSKMYNRAVMYIDSTGFGDPIYEDLAKKGANVRPFHINNSSKQNMINGLQIFIENKQIWLPPEKELVREFQAYTFETTPQGNIKYGAPPGMHDDIVISVALAAFGIYSFTECIGIPQPVDDNELDEEIYGKDEDQVLDWDEEEEEAPPDPHRWRPAGLRILQRS